jgi:hypothetical protein
VWIAVIAAMTLVSTAWPAVSVGADPPPPATTDAPPVEIVPSGSTDGTVAADPSAPDQPVLDPAAGVQPTATPTPADQPAPDAAADQPAPDATTDQPAPDATADQAAPDPAGGESTTDSGATPQPSPDPAESEGASDEAAAPNEGAAPATSESAPPPASPAAAKPPRPHAQPAPAPPVRPAALAERSAAPLTSMADPSPKPTVPAPFSRVRTTPLRATTVGELPALAPAIGLPGQGLIAALQPQTAPPQPIVSQRDPGGRTPRHRAAQQPRATEREPRPPLHRPSDNVAASAAGAGSTAPPTVWCALFAACTALAALELRRFGARLLVPEAPGAPSLRDRPG